MFRRDSQLVYVVGLLYGEVAMNCMFLLGSYRCKIEQPDTIQHNGMTNSENRNVHEETSCFVTKNLKCFP